MSDPYCQAQHPDGWFCILTTDHDGAHLSMDNRRRWRGTVGHPVAWADAPSDTRDPEEVGLDVQQQVQPAPATAPTYGEALAATMQARTGGVFPLSAQVPEPTEPTPPATAPPMPKRLPGYSGIPCGSCGGMNTVRIGKCLRCAMPPLGCGETGECG